MAIHEIAEWIQNMLRQCIAEGCCLCNVKLIYRVSLTFSDPHQSTENQRMMRADTCSCSRCAQAIVTLRGLATVLVLLRALAGLPAAAQSQANVNRDQAVLPVQATIIPVVVARDHRGANQLDLAINYNFPSDGMRLFVTEEFPKLSPKREGKPEGEAIFLRTTTIVPE